jgi:hypothetical protein
MVSKSSYNELMQAYEERGVLLFEAVHLVNQFYRDNKDNGIYDSDEGDLIIAQTEDFLSRARMAGMA